MNLFDEDAEVTALLLNDSPIVIPSVARNLFDEDAEVAALLLNDTLLSFRA
jgi:hypothetical protein